MSTLNINGKNYDLDKVSEAAKGQLAAIQFIETESQRLNAQLKVFNTARQVHIEALLKELDPPANKPARKPTKAASKPRKE